jgi:hypothetical protein
MYKKKIIMLVVLFSFISCTSHAMNIRELKENISKFNNEIRILEDDLKVEDDEREATGIIHEIDYRKGQKQALEETLKNLSAQLPENKVLIIYDIDRLEEETKELEERHVQELLDLEEANIKLKAMQGTRDEEIQKKIVARKQREVDETDGLIRSNLKQLNNLYNDLEKEDKGKEKVTTREEEPETSTRRPEKRQEVGRTTAQKIQEAVEAEQLRQGRESMRRFRKESKLKKKLREGKISLEEYEELIGEKIVDLPGGASWLAESMYGPAKEIALEQARQKEKKKREEKEFEEIMSSYFGAPRVSLPQPKQEPYQPMGTLYPVNNLVQTLIDLRDDLDALKLQLTH